MPVRVVYDPYGIPALTPETWAASFDSHLMVISQSC